MTVNMQYLCRALLFQCIFAGEYSRLHAPHHSQLIVYKQKSIKSLH